MSYISVKTCKLLGKWMAEFDVGYKREGSIKKVKFCAVLSSAVYIPSLFHVCLPITRVFFSDVEDATVSSGGDKEKTMKNCCYRLKKESGHPNWGAYIPAL